METPAFPLSHLLPLALRESFLSSSLLPFLYRRFFLFSAAPVCYTSLGCLVSKVGRLLHRRRGGNPFQNGGCSHSTVI
jgi:hypothetical protein